MPNLLILVLAYNQLTGQIPDFNGLSHLIYFNDHQMMGTLTENTEETITISEPIIAESSPVTVTMLLNQNRYTAGEKLRLDMEVNGQGIVDLYVAIIFPDGNYQTIAYPLNLSFNNTIQVYKSNIEITTQEIFKIMNLNLPQVPLGPYQTCGVLLWASEEPNLAQSNWIDIHCAAFEVY